MQFEVIKGLPQPDYYTGKISQIEQDVKGNESQVKVLFSDKREYIVAWAECLEELHRLGTYKKPVNTICFHIVNRLKELDCTSGVRTAYRSLDIRFKNVEMSELGQLPGHDEGALTNDTVFRTEDFTKLGSYLNLPHPIGIEAPLPVAPKEWIQENEEALARKAKEIKRQWQEYIDIMRQRGIPRVGQKESDVIGTPRPYDASYGFFYQELVGLPLDGEKGGLAEDLEALTKTVKDMAAKIGEFPPETQKEDKALADGIKPWRVMFQWLNEHLRPYADEKFSQSYPDWWATEALNKDFGKHAAAVKSKVVTVSGKLRGLTREQVGDKIPDLAEKALHFQGMQEIANKAFVLLQKDLPNWRRKRLDPSVGERKYNVGPKLSESAFGSGKDS